MHWFLAIPGTIMVVSAWYEPEPPWIAWLLSIVGALMIALSLCFRQLRVRDDGEQLEIAFGPVGLFRSALRYDQILGVTVTRSALIDGWGIHRLPGRGWIWNLWGYDCVALDLRDGTRLRIGSDEAQALADFLAQRTGLSEATHEEA